MVSCVRPSLLLPLLFLAGSALAAQGQVWHVAAAGGDFTTIQAAVDAASDGDTIVVAAGFYQPFTIDAKGLTITAAAGASPKISASFGFPIGVVVQNLGPAQSVTIRRISASRAAELQNNQGSVWLEDLSLGNSLGSFGDSLVGLDVNGCASVVVTRCKVSSNGCCVGGSDGNPGLRAVDSSVHLFESQVTGGEVKHDEAGWTGGPGAEITGSLLVASGSTFTGGQGKQGGVCSDGAPGGSGLVAGTGSEAWLLDTPLAGGPGGCALETWCGCGVTGAASLELGGSIGLLSGYGRDYKLSSPVAGGQTFQLDFSGVPGDLVFSIVSLAQAASFQPLLSGTLVLPVPPLALLHGPVDPLTGVLPPTAVPAPVLPAGVGALTVYAQGAALTAVGSAVVCAPSALTIL